jgi:trigger factor
MADPIITNLPKSQVKIVFSVTPEEAQPYLEQAVRDITEHKPLKGFRPGKASYNDVKAAYGEMSIWEAALERIVRAKYVKAIIDSNLDTIGSPEISVEKLVPGQNLEFTTISNLMPTVSNLLDYSTPLVTRKKQTVSEKDVDESVEELRKMRRSETAVDRAATAEDVVVIDLEIFKDSVLVEGGSTQNYKVFLNENHVIPGFAEKLVGAKKGDTKKFELEFPKDHYNKMLAGAMASFVAVVKEVFELALPEVTEEFAKGLGTESVANLRDLLRKNLQEERDRKIDEATEIEMIEKITKGSRFTEIPELLINEEVRRMYAELEHNAEERGMRMADYLSSIKKSADEIKMDFIPQAIQRIQTAVVIKEIANRENIVVDDAEIEAEQDRILDSIPKNDTETRARIASPEYREYIGVQMKNRKSLNALKAKAIKGE